MKINLVHERIDGRTNIEWDTNESLPYVNGGVYRFAGIDSQPDGQGALTLTLTFRDVADLDEFADIAQGAFHPRLTADQNARWQRFTVALRALANASPRRTVGTMHAAPLSIPWTGSAQYPPSYHADVDARRGCKYEGDE